MQRNYYRMLVDPSDRPRWFPGAPATEKGLKVDARVFTNCTRYTGESLVLPTADPGPRSPITFGPFDMPVVEVDVGEKLRAAAGDAVQLVPAVADDERVYVLNVLQRLHCIDEARTVGERWTGTDGRPEKVGEYRMIVELFVDPARADGASIFRVGGWQIALVVSDAVAELLNEREREGIVLHPVS